MSSYVSSLPTQQFILSNLSRGSSRLKRGRDYSYIKDVLKTMTCGGFHKSGYPKNDGLSWKIPLGSMIWGYPHFRKPPFLGWIQSNFRISEGNADTQQPHWSWAKWQPMAVFSLRRTESSIVFSITSTESSDFGGVRQDVVRPCAGTSREIYNA